MNLLSRQFPTDAEMRRVIVATAVVLAGLQLPSSTRAASRVGQRTVKVTAHGVRLSLNVPRRVYPRNALVKVTVEATNLTDEALGIWTLGPDLNGYSVLQPEVLTKAGKVVYPPVLPEMGFGVPAGTTGVPPGPVGLPPHSVFPIRAYVILRAPYLRARLELGGITTGPGPYVVTPSLRVILKRTAAPRVRVRRTSFGAVAIIDKPVDEHGPLRYEDWRDCDYGLASGRVDIPKELG